MKHAIIIMFLLLVSGCIEDQETDDITRCNNTVVEVWDGEEWQPDFDCAEYIVAHSGKL